jgi:hypothetical protein
MIEVGNAIVLKNASASDIIDSCGDTLTTKIEGLKVFLPGQLIPIICERDQKCPAFAQVTSVTITETNTSVEYTVMSTSDDVREAAYSQYVMTNGESIMGSYKKRAPSRGDRFHL